MTERIYTQKIIIANLITIFQNRDSKADENGKFYSIILKKSNMLSFDTYAITNTYDV